MSDSGKPEREWRSFITDMIESGEAVLAFTRDHRKTPVIPASKPLHSRGRGRFSGRYVHPESTKTTSFPRTREPRINKARLFTPSQRPFHKPHRSRGRGRFSGRYVHPESTKTTSFPRTREPRINKARLLTPSQRPFHKPHRSRGRGRFSGPNVHPDSTKTPSFPRTRESRINKARLLSPSRRPLPKPPPFPRQSHVIPADAGASADGTSTQNQQSTPFNPIPATTTVPFARRGCTNP